MSAKLPLQTWACPQCKKAWRLRASNFPFKCICGFKAEKLQAQTGTRPRDCVKEPCVSFGELLRQQEHPTCCGGKTKIKVFACAKHGECTLDGKRRLPQIECCQSCGDYLYLRPAIAVRNLIYHVCPLATNDGWRHNVRQLVRRFGVFNGQLVIAIATGDGLESPSEVHREFGGEDYDFFTVENDRQLREVASFLPLLERVKNANADEATFYAHTKGNSTAANIQGAILWRNAMYRSLLDTGASQAMEQLRHHAFVGCHKMVWGDGKPPYPSGLAHGNWFLAGTFFWFRHDRVFDSDRWRNIPRDRYGAEAWPAGLIHHSEAASLYQKFPEQQQYTIIDNPYNPSLYAGEGLEDEPA
jgi:hypothetical protein